MNRYTQRKRARRKRCAKNVLPRIVLDDLTRSGLTRHDAVMMGIEYLAPGDERWEKLAKIFKGLSVPVYSIPYFDTYGKQIDSVRFRVLGEFRLPGEKKPCKYVQLPGSTPRF